MSRAGDVLRGAAWWALALASLLWWAPSIAFALARFPLGRLRFVLVLSAAAVLREVGAVGAARAIYMHERARCERLIAVVRARRGW